MSLRNILLLFTAIAIAAGAVYFARSWLDSERAALEALRKPDAPEKPDTVVLVAKRDLPRGSFVKVEDLRWQAWPDSTVDRNYVLQGKGKPEDFQGAVVRYPVVAGEPITGARLVKPGERGFLAAALTPGMRAITIPVSVTSGVAGFVFPGDRVDLLLTHRFKKGKGNRYVTETLMPELRVIAIDQKLNPEKEGARVSKTITFEVSPKEVEMITVSRRLGALSLSLRSLADAPDLSLEEGVDMEAASQLGIAANDTYPEPRGRGYTWDREVSAVLSERAATSSVLIIRGGRRSAQAVKDEAEEDTENSNDGDGDLGAPEEAEPGELVDE